MFQNSYNSFPALESYPSPPYQHGVFKWGGGGGGGGGRYQPPLFFQACFKMHHVVAVACFKTRLVFSKRVIPAFLFFCTPVTPAICLHMGGVLLPFRFWFQILPVKYSCYRGDLLQSPLISQRCNLLFQVRLVSVFSCKGEGRGGGGGGGWLPTSLFFKTCCKMHPVIVVACFKTVFVFSQARRTSIVIFFQARRTTISVLCKWLCRPRHPHSPCFFSFASLLWTSCKAQLQ